MPEPEAALLATLRNCGPFSMPKRRESSSDEAGFDVSWWDEDLGRMVSWVDTRTAEYRRLKAVQHFTDWRHPMFWAMQAIDLHEAAEYLWRRYERHRGDFPAVETPPVNRFPKVALMLAGMSLECALKAYLLCAYPWPIGDAQLRSVAGGAHDLEALLKKTLMRCNGTDRDTLRQLSQFVRWSGRYPIPRRQVELESGYAADGEMHDHLWRRYEEAWKKFGRRISREVDRYLGSGGRGRS